MRIALVSYRSNDEQDKSLLVDEDQLLADSLISSGTMVDRIKWTDRDTDWAGYDAVVIKSPWDYHKHIDEFRRWLSYLKTNNIQIFNSYNLIEWNVDKHYLLEVARSGLPVIESIIVEKNAEIDVLAVFEHFRTDKVVIKPVVSASAHHTSLLSLKEPRQVQRKLKAMLSSESCIIQPYMEEINNGEWSFIFLNGEYSHAVLKVPAKNDFRVQAGFGGIYHAAEPGIHYIRSAQKYIDLFARFSLYGRVDGIISRDKFVLMELELVEPYLFLTSQPNAVHQYAKAINARL